MLDGSIRLGSAFANGGEKGAPYMCLSEISEKYSRISARYASNVALFFDDSSGLVPPDPSVMCERDLDVAERVVHAAALLRVQAPNLQVCRCLLLSTSPKISIVRCVAFLCVVCVSR